MSVVYDDPSARVYFSLASRGPCYGITMPVAGALFNSESVIFMARRPFAGVLLLELESLSGVISLSR